VMNLGNEGIFRPDIPLDLLDVDWFTATRLTRWKVAGDGEYSKAYITLNRSWVSQIIILRPGLRPGYPMERDWLAVFKLHTGFYVRLDFNYCDPRRMCRKFSQVRVALSFTELMQKAFTADEREQLLDHLPDVVEWDL
jgi:hypothetical protein